MTTGPGGCIYSELQPGAAGSRSNRLQLSDCEFRNSSAAAAGQGGAVAVILKHDHTATIIIEWTRFVSNNATEAGGLAVVGTCRPNLYASCRNQTDAALQTTTCVVNCTFERNTAARAGAMEAVYNTAQGLHLSGVEFRGNDAHDTAGLLAYVIPHVTLEDCLFVNQTAEIVMSGARLASIHSRANVTRSAFRSNVCNRNNPNTGSALYVYEGDGVTVDGEPSGPLFDFHLSHTTFEDNWSTSEGGGLTVQRCPTRLDNVTFARNRASRKGGAMYLLERDLTAAHTYRDGGSAEAAPGCCRSTASCTPSTSPNCWESVSQTQVMLLVLVDVFGRTLLVTQQALLLEVVLLANLVVNSFSSPLLQEELTLLLCCSCCRAAPSICLTLCLGLMASVPGSHITQGGQAALGGVVAALNCLIIAAFVFAYVRRGLPGFRTSLDAAKLKVSSARQLLAQRLSRQERLAEEQGPGGERERAAPMMRG
ncbi:hypothetical protein HYH02_005444 [Chlamydomonas schloesseri]|uniref:Right handed beta helix domain-containing protein n=1 Tax=Chlamydomonas schloesseri TaxID=2026947 RepID=A0A836B6R9_9CHLO|nr:hypothetical protein HYH02_005444 [Chlamydomonas schloesseri]|eukprot:KAG2449287.1 hypothetical protein HYH02_005444 [Chlamydomonas schloesseri]